MNIPDAVKTHGTRAIIGLNAAAVIFLYTHFVPQKDYDSLKTWVDNVQKSVAQLKVDLAVLQAQAVKTAPAH